MTAFDKWYNKLLVMAGSTDNLRLVKEQWEHRERFVNGDTPAEELNRLVGRVAGADHLNYVAREGE